jgi:DNA-binding SARP family transcriptional activator
MHAASTVYSHVGDVRAARRCIDEAGPTPAASNRSLTAGPALVTASLLLAEGDEARATETLRSALQRHDDAMDRGVDRHMWRHLLPLSYVLLPESRPHWDRLAQRGYLATTRELAAAVVALREGQGDRQLRDLDLSDLERVRAGLHHRFAAELAVGLAALGRPEGAALLEALGPAGRDAVRALATSDSPSTSATRTARTARSARALLGAVPAPPRQVAELSVLGPMALRLRGDAAPGVDVVDPDLGRKRLRALLAYLVIHRKTDRATIMAALWPDLTERAASNNLAVTLTYVLGALEPTRAAGEPAYLVRVEGRSVWLVTGSHLQVDVDRFEHHLAEAAQAEGAGTPSVALDHNLAAVELYRGELFADVPDADWMELDREHYRTRFVTAAVRAGQLLLGRGDSDEAEAMARRALAADPWAEEAYAVLVTAAVANGDRSGARRLLDRCIAALADIGVAPSDATRQLQRRVQGTIALASGS